MNKLFSLTMKQYQSQYKMTHIIVLLLAIVFSASSGERLHKQIYSSIEGAAACFRRLNGTHQAGCSSTDKGAVGVVEMIRDVSDAQWVVYNATAGPYMAVVSTAMFYDVVELFMGKPDNVAGVLIYDNITDSANAFTQESRCPNEYSSGPGSQCSSSQAGGLVWNEKGTGLLRRDIPFPVFYLPQSRAEEIGKIEECYHKFNLDRNNQNGNPLCSVQLNSFMFAAVNSEVCLRRSASSAIMTSTKVCDPLGDHNVYYSLFPLKEGKAENKKSVTLVTARIDTASLFDGISPGASSSVVGMVTLLTAAVTLSQLLPATDAQPYDHNILFTLFNGEAFDYIGSQRVAYDLSRGAWPPAAPLSPADISLHVELGQIGGALSAHSNGTAWPLYAFAPYPALAAVTEINEFLNLMTANANAYNMSVTINSESVTNLPPSSLHSFRRILSNLTETGELPELLLTDHERSFTNMYYNSALDEYQKIGFAYHNISVGPNGTFLSTEELLTNGTMKDTEMQVKIARLATALAQTLYQRVVGTKYAGDLTASAHLVDEMLYCFTRSQACRLLLAAEYSAGGEEQPAEQPAPLYVGVAAWAATAPVFAGHLLALLAGQRLAADKDDCNKRKEPGYSYYWLKGWNNTGECFQTTMNFTQAVSPAFIVPNYDMSSGLYSTWTESVWASMWARVFVSAGGGGARAAAGAGVAATLLAALATFWLHRHRDLLFAATAALPAPDDATSGILRTVNC